MGVDILTTPVFDRPLFSPDDMLSFYLNIRIEVDVSQENIFGKSLLHSWLRG